MGTPTDENARRFYRVAYQRCADGESLEENHRYSASIYLTGYAVECMLKALLLMTTPSGQRSGMLAMFRGARAHNLTWLHGQLAKHNVRLPAHEVRHFVFVNSWSTDLRYEPGPGNPDDAKAFLVSAKAILEWADGRI